MSRHFVLARLCASTGIDRHRGRQRPLLRSISGEVPDLGRDRYHCLKAGYRRRESDGGGRGRFGTDRHSDQRDDGMHAVRTP